MTSCPPRLNTSYPTGLSAKTVPRDVVHVGKTARLLSIARHEHRAPFRNPLTEAEHDHIHPAGPYTVKYRSTETSSHTGGGTRKRMPPRLFAGGIGGERVIVGALSACGACLRLHTGCW